MRRSRGSTLRAVTVTAVSAGLLALGGCGSEGGLTVSAAEALHDRVATVRASATSGDREAAQAALDAFRADVHQLVEAGELDPAEAVTLLAQVDRVGADVAAEVRPTPTPTPKPTPTLKPEPALRPMAEIREREDDRRDRDERRERGERGERGGQGEWNGDDDDD